MGYPICLIVRTGKVQLLDILLTISIEVRVKVASETMGNKLHRREGNSPDHQLRPLNDRSVIKEVGVLRLPGGSPGSSHPSKSA